MNISKIFPKTRVLVHTLSKNLGAKALTGPLLEWVEQVEIHPSILSREWPPPVLKFSRAPVLSIKF